MLLRHRVPRLESQPVAATKGFEHLDERWIAVLRWLQANRVEFVLVGYVARAIRGDTTARGPVAIVPAPYGRNLERLARALLSAHAKLRIDGAADPESAAAETMQVKITGEKLLRGQRWTLRCGTHDLDIEGRPSGVPGYQELLYEAVRFELAPGVTVEAASPEDIELYDHVRRTGISPEFRVVRNSPVENE
jgi:hypothetical protein